MVIEIKDSHEMEGETHASEFLCDGTLTATTDGGWELDYIENDGPDASRAALRVQNRMVSLTRRGAYPMELTLEQGVRHSCYYNTPAGLMHLGIYARSVESDISPAGGNIKLAYTLDFCADLMSSNQMEIKVQARG